MIVPMKRLTIVALQSDEEAILRALQNIGAVQIIKQEDGAESIAVSSEAMEKLKRLEEASRALSGYEKKPSMFTPKPEVERGEFLRLKDSEEPIILCTEIERINDSVSKCDSEITSTENLLRSMEPWKELDNVKIEDIRPTKHANIVAGFIPVKNMDEASELSIDITRVSADSKNYAVIIACHRSDEGLMMSRLREFGFTAYNFGGMTGTPRHAYNTLWDRLESLKKQRKDLIHELEKLSERGTELRAAADAQGAEYELDMAREDILHSASAFLIEAWVREDEAMKVDQTLRSVTNAYYIEARDPAEDEIPPTVVQNNRFIKPFESITNLYSRPDHRGIDATPLMAPFYLLFFAMMLSDTGYGLLLFLGGLLFKKLKKPTGMMNDLTQVIAMGGLATAIVGPFIGTFFGMSFNQLFLGTETGPFPLLMDPLGDAMSMLILCCGLGIVHMIFGLCIKMYMFIKRGDKETAIFDCMSWIFIIIGLVGMIGVPGFAAPFAIIALVGVFMILLFAGRAKKGIKRLTKGVGSLYDITGWMSDIVSYARIFAMGLVTGAMGEVFNTLGGMLSGAFPGIMKIVGVIAAIAVLIALHGFSLFMNTLGSFSHTARLQYIEFYGKFYEAGGREFKPLGYHTKNVTLK